jgi:hypothetical protein
MSCTMYFPAPSHTGEQLPYLLTAQHMAALTGFAPRTLRRFKETGRILKPNQLGLWQRDEVLCWIANGMPVDPVWQQTKPKRFRVEQSHKVADRKL